MRDAQPSARDLYVEGLYAQEDDGLRSVRERLMTAGRWGVNIGANEGRMLQVLIRLAGVRRAVEIGTLFGYSSVWMARALPADGTLFTIERDWECVRQARQSFEECGVEERITLLEGDAEEKLREISQEGPFDLVFIDANKSAYFDYLKWALHNVRSGGLIIADNTLLGGGVVFEEKPAELSSRQWTEMRRFNEAVARGGELFGTIFPTTEGLTVAIRQ